MTSLDIISNAQELIRSRTSIRTYDSSVDVKPEVNLIRKFFNYLPSSPFSGSARFELVQLGNVNRLKKLRLGTYGFVKRAENFIIGILTEPSAHDLENIGFLFECLILFATKLNLGTVWLGGTFNRRAFSNHLKLSEGETIPIISPLGKSATKQTYRSRAIKSIAQSKTRRPWEKLFFDTTFERPLPKDVVKEYEVPLEMVRLAPSSSNSQPWRVIFSPEENKFHFYIYRRSSRSRNLFSWPDFSRIDLGIGICHFNICVEQMQLPGNWQFDVPIRPEAENMDYLISWVPR